MCRQVSCKLCKKTTWAGCGQHVDQVMKGVPRSERCACTANDKEAARKKTLFGRIFG
jgi:hypothetical protein